jgi:ribonuclease I
MKDISHRQAGRAGLYIVSSGDYKANKRRICVDIPKTLNSIDLTFTSYYIQYTMAKQNGQHDTEEVKVSGKVNVFGDVFTELPASIAKEFEKLTQVSESREKARPRACTIWNES